MSVDAGNENVDTLSLCFQTSNFSVETTTPIDY